MEFQLPARIKLPDVQREAARPSDPTAPTKGQPWTEGEHVLFLQGLRSFGKGKWRQISRTYLHGRKTPTQVASHAQKYYSRLQGRTKRASRFTVIEESVSRCTADRVPASPLFICSTATSGSGETSGSSEGWSQDSQAVPTKPCRPTACKATPELSGLQDVLSLTVFIVGMNASGKIYGRNHWMVDGR